MLTPASVAGDELNPAAQAANNAAMPTAAMPRHNTLVVVMFSSPRFL
jgi:hypothetical protein